MRHAAWVIPPLVLAAVLGLSAVAKWGRGESLHAIIRNLRLPAWTLPSWLAPAIPGVEVALAVGLLTPWRPVFTLAAVGVTVLMVVYWGLIARGLTLTPRPACGCFGSVGDHGITARTLLRNSLLVGAALSAVGLAASGRTLWSLLSDFGTPELLWLALAASACAVTALVVGRGAATPAETSSTPDLAGSSDASDADTDDYVRTPIPSSLLHDPDTGPRTLLELSRRRAQLLVFVNCYCASTKEVMTLVGGWNARLDLVDVRMVFSVPIAEKFVGTPPVGTLLDHAGLVWTALGLTSSPSAVLLGVDGYLAGGPVGGSADVREFVDDIEDSLRDAGSEPLEPVVATPVDADVPPAAPASVTSDR